MTIVKSAHTAVKAGRCAVAEVGPAEERESPIREAFIYRLLETLRVPALKARPVRISYVDVKHG